MNVGQVVNLPADVNRPVAEILSELLNGPITNRPQVTNLPHIRLSQMDLRAMGFAA